MKASKRINAIKILRAISSTSGFFALASFVLILITVYAGQKCMLYYISGGIFIAFASIFSVTVLFFMLRSLIWHVKVKRMRYLIRHYFYAFLAIFVILTILDQIMLSNIGWINNIMIAPFIALISVYLSGYFLTSKKGIPDSVSEPT